MRGATWRTLGTVGFGLVAVLLVLGLSGATFVPAGAASHARDGGTTLVGGHAARPVGPDASALATYVQLTGVTGPTTVSVLPAWVNFTIAYGNVNASMFSYNTIISPTNTTVILTIYNVSGLTNYAVNSVPIVQNQTAYSVMLDSSYLGCATSDCTTTMTGAHGYSFSLWVQLDATGAGGTKANSTAADFATTSFVTTLPTWVNARHYMSGAATGPAKYSPLPAWINFSIDYGGVGPSFALSAANTAVWLSVLNEVTHATANYSVPIVTGQTDYTLTLTASGLQGCTQANCSSTFGSMNQTYSFSLWPSLNGSANRGVDAGTNGTLFVPLAVASFILYAPSFYVTAPAPTVTSGNITVTANYTALFVTNAVVNIYSVGTLGGAPPTLVFTANYLEPPGSNAPISHTWIEGTPGSYFVSFVATLDYATMYVNGTVTVVAPSTGGVVYQNTTVYKNVTGGSSPAGFFGLSPAASGTVFLLVGLIVGILAGLVAARMIMSPGPAKPAQPWTEKKEETSNTCSVCGKSFGSADELAAHAKSEHGMQ
jgi:hypothetical protein